MSDQAIEKLIQDIKDLKVQGNTNIAKTAVSGLLDYITNSKEENFALFVMKVKEYGLRLANARPNEPLAYNAITFIIKDLDECQTKQQIRVKAIDRIENFFKYIDESYEIIRNNAVNILNGKRRFMTHCHSSLSRDVLIKLNLVNPGIEVINTETRPKFQGRITATKLASNNIKVTHIVDSAVSSFLLDKRYPKPEAILVGSDGITVNGDLVNKVGTYNIALAAAEAGIPIYGITQSMKLDLRSSDIDFEIELRDKSEVWDTIPENVNVINPSFDLVPAKFITGGYITEKGLLKPEDFNKIV